MKSLPILLALILALPLTTGCGKRKVGKPRMGEVERLPRLETVVVGKPSRIEVVRSYTATVEAFEKADLCAMVKGSVKEIPADLDIGRVVTKDELLMALYAPDLSADKDNKKALVDQSEKEEARAVQAVAVADAEIKEAEANRQRYEADTEFRKVQYARIGKLAQGNTLSPQQVDEAKLQLNTAEAAMSSAQAQVVTKRSRLQAAQKEVQVAASKVRVARTELDRSAVQVEFASLRAPFAGVITKRWIDTGTTVKDPGMPLFTIMRTDKMRVILDVPERDVPYFRTGPQGNEVKLHVPALQELIGLDKIPGTITLMASALDPVTRTMRAEMHLDNKVSDKPGLLKPQMTGTAYVTLAVREAVTVPASALVRAGNKMEIYIVADPTGEPPRGAVKRMEVQIGLDDGLRVEIRNENLTGRELVIVRGAGVLRPGDQVIAITAKQAE